MNKNEEDLKKKVFREIREKHNKEMSEEEREQVEKLREKIGKKRVNMLEENGYDISNKGLAYINETENEQYIDISNLIVIPCRQINEISAEGKVDSYIELECIIIPTGEKLEKIKVSIAQLENGNCFSDYRWWSKTKFEKSDSKKLQIESINLLKQCMKKSIVYKFVGFIESSEKKIFLHSGGVIGTEELIETNLENKNLSRYDLTTKEFELKDTLELTFECEKLADIKTTTVLLATIFSAPILNILEELDIQHSSATLIIGTQKNEILSMLSKFISHFGFFNKNNILLNVYDEIPKVKEIAMKCRNVAVVANCFTSSETNEVKMKKLFLENIISLYANQSSDEYKINGELIIATSTILELNERYIYRTLIVNVENLSESKVSFTKEQQEKLHYTMKKYIEYIIGNYEGIKNMIKEAFQQKIQEAEEKMSFEKAEVIASKYVGLLVLIDFAYKSKVIEESKKEEKLQEYWKTLCDLGEEQQKEEQQMSLIEMIKTAIEELANNQKINVVDYNSAKYMKLEEVKKDGFIGFYYEQDKTNLIYQKKLYQAISDYYKSQNKIFQWRESDMCKELCNHGFLYITKKQERPQIRRYNPTNSREETFIGILADKINIPCRYLERGQIYIK